MNEHLLRDYELLRLQNIWRNTAFVESLGIPDAVFAINQSNQRGAVGSGVRRQGWNNIRNDDDDNDDDDYHGNSVGRVRSSRNPAVPTWQMPASAAKSGEKRYYVQGEDDI
jgi:hypothetical protein